VLRRTLEGTPDPVVWQRVNGKTPEWYPDEMSFSVFIVKYLGWLHGVDLSDDDF